MCCSLQLQGMSSLLSEPTGEQAGMTLLRISLQVGPAVEALTKAPGGFAMCNREQLFFHPIFFFFSIASFSIFTIFLFFYKHAEDVCALKPSLLGTTKQHTQL